MYRFQVSAQTTVGESIGLVGSVPELGSWDVSRCVRLWTRGDRYPVWCSDVEIHSTAETLVDGSVVQYKYVRLCSDGKVVWEALGPNRWVPFPTEAQPPVVTVDDGEFGIVQPWPYGYSETPFLRPLLPQKPDGLKVVVLGSSVAMGCSAWLLQGWAWRLEQELNQRYGHQLVNVSALGANAGSTIERFSQVVVPQNPDVVIIALSLGNEGFAYCLPEHRQAVQQRFEDGVQQLIKMVREIGAVPIVGAVYPHREYTPEHNRYLQETHQRMLNWGVPVLDWLSVLEDGWGRWKPGISFDVGHPNTEGHRLMYETIALSLFDPQHLQALKKNPDSSHLNPSNLDPNSLPPEPSPSTPMISNSSLASPFKFDAETPLPEGTEILFNDEQLKIIKAGDRDLHVINCSAYEYNIHPMWKEVRSVLKAMPPGVYEDVQHPDIPFRTLMIGQDGLESRVKSPAKSTVTFTYQCALADVSRVGIIPLGDRCAPRMLLYKMEYDGPAFPFDLTRTSNLGDVSDMIATGFNDMWNPNLLHYNPDDRRVYHGKWSGLSFGHEVEDHENPLHDMSPVHERMRTRYSARANRFWYTIQHADKLLFIRTGGTQRGYVVDLLEKLEAKCAGKPFWLLLISPQSSEEFSSLPNVLHYNLEFNPDHMYADHEHWDYCTGIMRNILQSLGVSSKNLFWCPPNPSAA